MTGTQLTKDYTWNLTFNDAIARLNTTFASVFDGRVDADKPLSIRMTLYERDIYDSSTSYFILSKKKQKNSREDCTDGFCTISVAPLGVGS